MTALEYVNTFVPGWATDEEFALHVLIESHRRLRETNGKRMDWWRKAPKWKRRLLTFLQLRGILPV